MSTTMTPISTRNHDRQNVVQSKSITLSAILAVLFAVKFRESLDAATSGDKSDGTWIWGM